MKLKTLVGLMALTLAGLANAASSAEEPNSLGDEEKTAGWRLLFDGRSTAGWRGYKSTTVPGSWRVENGSLLSRRGRASPGAISSPSTSSTISNCGWSGR